VIAVIRAIIRTVTRLPLPGHDPLSGADYLIGLGIDGLADGRRLIVHGICLDIEDRLWLSYAWAPGITAPMGEESGVALNVEYGADVLPADLSCAGSYSTDGGASSEGEIGYARPPHDARHVWFDFSAADDPEGEHRVTRLTVDLITGQVATETPR
jgi:hypothetical protein